MEYFGLYFQKKLERVKMPSLKQHVSDCKSQLGKGWDVVHHWLDEYAKIYWPLMVHRVHRHHREGVEEVRSKWGDEAALAAEIHIIADEGDLPSRKDICKRYGVKDDDEQNT